MEVIGCGKGHFYDPSKYSSCPQCAKEGNPDFATLLGTPEPGGYMGYMGGVGPTEPLGGGGVGPTMPANGGPSAGDLLSTSFFGDGGSGGGQAQDYGATMPIGGNGGFQSANGQVQDYGATMPITPKSFQQEGNPQTVPVQPVVGWLVCVEGAAKGRDFRIHSQYNYIGKAQHMDICISGDDHISAERAAVIAYDDQERMFFFGPGMGKNLVRVNGKMIMGQTVLNAYDVLSIGMTKLVFVPLCGERFDWDDC